MSKLNKVQTQIKNVQSLIAALKELGLEYEASPNLQQNSFTTTDYFNQNYMAAIIVSRSTLNRAGYDNRYGDIAFAYNPQTNSYDMLCDHTDNMVAANKIKQTYAVTEIKSQAARQGMRVSTTFDEKTGNIEVVVVGRQNDQRDGGRDAGRGGR